MTLVAAFETGAGDGLLEGIAGEDAEDHGDTCIHLRELDAARGFGADVVVVGSFAAEDAANADDGVAGGGLREAFCGDGDLERAGHLDNFDLFCGGAGLLERLFRSGEETVGDEVVEATDDDTEAEAARIKCAA